MPIELAKTVACKLIGIHGHAGTGKDTVADYIREKYDNTWKLPFAGPLKEACAAMFGVMIDEFYDHKVKELTHPAWGISPRQMAQFFGTEMVRETIGKLLPNVGQNFWIAHMEKLLCGELNGATYDSDDVVIIPDVRFQNEADWIWRNGGIIIHLTRPGADGKVGISSHASEAGIAFSSCPECSYRIENNRTLEELYESVETILTHAKIYPYSNPDSF